MNRETAMAIFNDLEGVRIAAVDEETEERWQETPFNVRLDAGTVQGLDLEQTYPGGGAPYATHRTWRIFVTWSGTSWASDDLNGDWAEVVAIATKHKALVRPENNGLAIG